MRARPVAAIRNTFLAGLLVVIPLAVTAYLTVWLFRATTDVMPWVIERLSDGEGRAVLRELLGRPAAEFALRTLSLFFFFAAICAIGVIARNVVGRRILRLLESIISRVPMVGAIHSTVKQIGHAIFNSANTDVFRKVVLIEYPRPDCYAIGFLTSDAHRELNIKSGRDLVGVFLPTTPNPTSGYLLFLPREDVMVLNVTITQAMRMIISGNVVKPDSEEEDQSAAKSAPAAEPIS